MFVCGLHLKKISVLAPAILAHLHAERVGLIPAPPADASSTYYSILKELVEEGRE